MGRRHDAMADRNVPEVSYGDHTEPHHCTGTRQGSIGTILCTNLCSEVWGPWGPLPAGACDGAPTMAFHHPRRVGEPPLRFSCEGRMFRPVLRPHAARCLPVGGGAPVPGRGTNQSPP